MSFLLVITTFLFHLSGSSHSTDVKLNDATLQVRNPKIIQNSTSNNPGGFENGEKINSNVANPRNEDELDYGDSGSYEDLETLDEGFWEDFDRQTFLKLLFGPNGSSYNDPLIDNSWDETHIVKIHMVTPSGVKWSGGALVRDRIVVTCCSCVGVSDSNGANSLPVIELKDEDDILVTRGVTGETSYVNKRSFGIRRYCIDDPDTNIAVILILTNPLHTEPLRLAHGRPHSHCRLYAFNKKKYSEPEPSILGHYDLNVLTFVPNAPICQNATTPTNDHVICGAVIDNNQKFCGFLPGAVVFCDLRLMGVSQTTCEVPYRRTSRNNTRVLIYVSLLTRQELRYWQKLIAKMGQVASSSRTKIYYLPIKTTLIIALGIVIF